MHASAAAQCAGITQRGDHWDWFALLKVLQWISGGTYPQFFDPWYDPANGPFTSQIFLAGAGCPGGRCFTRWVWMPVVMSDAVPYAEWAVVSIAGTVPAMNLVTGVQYASYLAVPWANRLTDLQGLVVASQPGHPLDTVWLNPI